MTEAEARAMLDEIRSVMPRKTSGRQLCILSRDEQSIEVWQLSKSRKRAVYSTTVRLDGTGEARYRLPLDVVAWAKSRTGREQL